MFWCWPHMFQGCGEWEHEYYLILSIFYPKSNPTYLWLNFLGWFQVLSWLVVDLPLWKIWKSVGIIIPNIWKVMKFMFQTTNQFTLTNHQPSTSVNPTKKVFISLLLTAPPFLLSLPFFLGWQCGPPTGRLGVSLPRCDGFLLGFQLGSELLWYKYTDYKEHHRTWQKWIPWHLKGLWYSVISQIF